MNPGSDDNLSSINTPQKLHEYDKRLRSYREVKEQRDANTFSDAVAMETLLTYDISPIDTLETHLYSELTGAWYKKFIYINRNLYLERLDLEKLSTVCDGLIVNGNLIVAGGIFNLNGDHGPALIVHGDVLADCLICGGSEMHLMGHTSIQGFIFAHYNHGTLQARNIKALVSINSDHFSKARENILFYFSDYTSDGQLDISYLCKIFGTNSQFIDIDEQEEGDCHLNTHTFLVELIKNDIALLEAIKEHFSDHTALKQQYKNAVSSNNTQLIHTLKQKLDRYSEPLDFTDDSTDSEDDSCEPDDYDHIETTKFNFRLYTLADLEKLNDDIDEVKHQLKPGLKSISILFNKEKLSAIGLTITKMNKLLDSTDFNGVTIYDREKTLTELGRFEDSLNSIYTHQRNVYISITFAFLLLALLYPNYIIILLIVAAFYTLRLYNKHRHHSKNKKWLSNAREYTNNASTTPEIDTQSEPKKVDELAQVMSFLRYAEEQEKNDWSVKLFDWIANKLKGK